MRTETPRERARKHQPIVTRVRKCRLGAIRPPVFLPWCECTPTVISSDFLNRFLQFLLCDFDHNSEHGTNRNVTILIKTGFCGYCTVFLFLLKMMFFFQTLHSGFCNQKTVRVGHWILVQPVYHYLVFDFQLEICLKIYCICVCYRCDEALISVLNFN